MRRLSVPCRLFRLSPWPRGEDCFVRRSPARRAEGEGSRLQAAQLASPFSLPFRERRTRQRQLGQKSGRGRGGPCHSQTDNLLTISVSLSLGGRGYLVSKGKIVFQSFFILITIQRFLNVNRR